MRSLFGGRRRKIFGHGRELGAYRNELFERTQRIDAVLATVGDEIDALRRRALDADVVVERLGEHESLLDAESSGLIDMMAPEELHGLHMEYEANLERALRGIVTVERGCAWRRSPRCCWPGSRAARPRPQSRRAWSACARADSPQDTAANRGR